MDRSDIERIARMEAQLNQLAEKVEKILEMMEDYNSHQYECEKKFVKTEMFPSLWDSNMKRWESEKLQKTSNLLNFLNNAYRLILALAGIVIIINQTINK